MLLLLLMFVTATAQLMKHGCSRNLSVIRDSGFLADPLYYQERQQQQRHNSDNNSTASAASNMSGSGSSSSAGHERLIQQLQQHLGAGRQVLAVTLKQDFLPLLRRTLLQLLATTRFAVRPIAADNAREGCVKALFDC